MKPPVFVAIIIVASLGVWYGSGRSADRLDVARDNLNVANERIAFLGDQVSAYKDRLQGATPDQAAKQIAILSSNLEQANKKLMLLMPDTPRTLTDSQKQFISEHKAEFPKVLTGIPVFSWIIGDANTYASDFLLEFKKNSIAAFGPISSSCDSSQRGVMVGLKNPENPPVLAASFIHLLTQMGVSPKTTKWEGEGVSEVDFNLFICG